MPNDDLTKNGYEEKNGKWETVNGINCVNVPGIIGFWIWNRQILLIGLLLRSMKQVH